jgi:hypothetical protein
MTTNPWANSDTYTTTEATRLRWLWAALYATIRDMAVALPSPVRLPHLPADATPEQTSDAAQIIERLRDRRLGRDLPGDILAMADRALTDAIAAHKAIDPGERRDLITEAQARVRAVVAYMGVGPEDVGVHDTWEETALLDH